MWLGAVTPTITSRIRPAGGPSNRTPTSASCCESTAAGAPVSGSEPEAVFGNAITSRIESRPARIATIRSIPSARPPCGGAPYLSASSRNPNRESASSSEIPSAVNTCCWTSGRLIRIDPPPISEPSSTMSYARERSAPGSSNEPSGAVNGWCSASQRCSFGFHSNIGKSITHSSSWRPAGIRS